MELDIDPRDHEAFYSAFLDHVEGHSWLLRALEVLAVQNRIGKRKGVRQEVLRRKKAQIGSKMPSQKFALTLIPEIEERMQELAIVDPVPVELVVGAFVQNALEHFRVVTDGLSDLSFDDAVDEALGIDVYADDVEESLRDFIERTMKESSNVNDWTNIADILEILEDEAAEKSEVYLAEFKSVVNDKIHKLAASLDGRSSALDYTALARIAELGIRIDEKEPIADVAGVMENLCALGFDLGDISVTGTLASTLTDPRFEGCVDAMPTVRSSISACADELRTLEQEIELATKDRRFTDLGDLGKDAGKLQGLIKEAERLEQSFRELFGRIRNGELEDLDADLTSLNEAFSACIGDSEADDDVDAEVDEPCDEANSAPDGDVEGAEIEDDEPEQQLEPEGDDSAEESPEAQEVLEAGDKNVVVDIADDEAESDRATSERPIEAAPVHDVTVEESDFSEEETSGDGPVPAAFLRSLVRKDLTGAAADFASVLENEGYSWPIESEVLRAAAGGRARLGEFSPDVQTFEFLAQQAKSSVKTDQGSTMLLGALLRPALVHKSTGLRIGIASLAQGNLGSHLKDVGEAIEGLNYDFPPDPDALAEISGGRHEPRERRLAKRLAEWVDTISQKSSRWTLATGIMRHVVSRNGPIGAAVEAINSGSPDARALAKDCIKRLSDVNSLASEAAKYCEYINKPHLRLHTKSVEYLLRTFAEANQLLAEWVAATDRKANQGRKSAERLRTVVANLVSRLKNAKRGVSASVAAKNLNGAIAEWLCLRLDEAVATLQGNDVGRFASVEKALLSDRNLLSSATRRDIEEGEASSNEIADLGSEGVLLPQDAFANACKDGSFEVATSLAEQYELASKSGIPRQIADFTSHWGNELLERQRALKVLAKVDYSHQNEIRRYLDWCTTALDRLSGVAAGKSLDDLDDIPSYMEVLEVDAREIEKTIRKDQVERIKNYTTDANSEEAGNLLKGAGDLTLEAVEDRIAQLRDGRSAAAFEAELDGMVGVFTSEFLRFATSNDWPNGVKQFEAAFENEGLLFVDEGRRDAAIELTNLYVSLRGAIPKGAPSSEKVKALFEEIGFLSVRVKAASKIGRTKSWRMSMDADILSDGWFLPPVFGSKANNGYDLLLVASDSLPEAVLQSVSPKRPIILLLAGVANEGRRREFAERLRARAIPAALIDEAMVVFAAIRRETRISTVFDCGLPYGRVEPYTTDAGQIPEEMFFGRSQEIRDIMSTTADGCLVYGGRQLGKSALLNHVERTCHSPENDIIVVRREVKPLGNVEKTSEIWTHLNAMLVRDGVVSKESCDADSICRDVHAWLNDHPSGQIVCMFDETDHFMTADTKEDYPQLSRLKELMEDTDRRFKVVFAGLHNVQRVLRQPNSPLAHLGRAICIGPLNLTDDDKRAAFDLVIRPMRAAGFCFETMEAVEDILAWANYFPSLIQEYGKGLLSSLHGAGSGQNYRLQEGSPLWVIPKANLFDNSGFSEIESRVRDKFHLTLDLDPRYALVAYTLAGLNADGFEQQALVSGFKPQEILAHAISFRPKDSVIPSPRAFDALLDELFDLGVLGRVKISGSQRYRYLLRTREVALMLGSREDVDHALLELAEKEPSVSYDRTIHRRRYDPEGKPVSVSRKQLPYSPLTDFAIERLLDRDEPGVKVVCGLKVLGLSKVPVAFRRIAEESSLPGLEKGAQSICEPASEKDIRAIFDASKKSDEGVKILLHRPQSADDAHKKIVWMDRQEAVLDGRILPIILLNAGDEDERALAIRLGESVEFLSAWGVDMLRVHLNNIEQSELDTKEMRENIMSKTGGIPADVVEFVAELARTGDPKIVFGNWEGRCLDVKESLDPVIAAAVLNLGDVETLEKEDYHLLDELIREEAGADLATLGPDLFAIGLLSKWNPKRYVIQASALGRYGASQLAKRGMVP